MVNWSLCRMSLLTALALVSGPLAAEEEPAPPAALDELKAAIAAVVAENPVPAVGIALVDENGPVWVESVGKADLEADIDADADSIFRIGSISKMFVSLAVLKLVEEGVLSLDDKVAELAPDIDFENPWEATDPVRLVHLLEHTTGWDDIHLPDYAHNVYPPVSLKEGLDVHPHNRVSRWIPGTRSSYCNAGPPVAAYIIEKVTGQVFEEYVEQNFFTPMGMRSATYFLSDEFEDRGVSLYANGNQPQPYDHLSLRPSGAINASPRDMARLLEFFVHRGSIDGRQLISPESLQRMESVESTSAARVGQESGYGLGNHSSSHKNWVFRSHGGGLTGAIANLAYLPEARVGHILMINSDDARSFIDISNLLRDFETRNLEPRSLPETDTVTAAHREIEGLYHPINPRQQLSFFLERVLAVQKLWFEGDKLMSRPLLGGRTDVFLPVSTALYAAQNTGSISLSRANDPLAGDVVHVHSQVLKPVPVVLAYGQLAVVLLWVTALVSSILFFLIWGIRRMCKKIPAGAAIRIRLWPLLASCSVVAVVLAFAAGMADLHSRLGSPTVFSISIMLSSAAFPLFAVLGVKTSIVERRTVMNRANYWHSAVASFTHLIVAVYLFWFGIVGLMTWA